jgi:ribonuclease Y
MRASREREGADVNSGIVLVLAIVACVVALAALVALWLVIRRSPSSPPVPSAGRQAGQIDQAGHPQEASLPPGSIEPGADAADPARADLLQAGAARPAPAAGTVPPTASPPTASPPTAVPPTAGGHPPGESHPSEAGRDADRQAAQEAAQRAEQLRIEAERAAAAIVARAEAAVAQADEARREVDAEIKTVKDEVRLLRADLERREVRLAEREQRIHEESRKVDQRADALEVTQAELDEQRAELQQLDAQRREVLERVAGLTASQAKAELVAVIENQAKREAALIIRDIEGDARKEGDKRARKIVTLAIQRVASDQTSESVVSVLHLPGDEMKGRIIGREGRNIRAFESVTGVNLIIDDTPEAVLLSCFDPVRREVGRLTLERLVLDGRIHPQRIEEAYERSKAEIEQLCVRAGEDALVDVGITEMHPELTNLLGRLRYRTSYGQNVLKHLVESAHIAGMMASELGMDPVLMKRCTVLHDIGKALTHEVQGSHALIGAEIARRYGESPDVVHAIEAHHNEVEVRTVEAVLTQAADAISGGRPGARRESLEAYVKRLERLEQIALSRDGVEKVFAMQAGREVRIMVKPSDVDDIQAQVIARDVAKQVEEELTYPGQIRVTVVRESRAIEFAR